MGCLRLGLQVASVSVEVSGVYDALMIPAALVLYHLLTLKTEHISNDITYRNPSASKPQSNAFL